MTMSSLLTRLRRPSNSKLSNDELAQLQKDTHFDKKELQQWYKGTEILEESCLVPTADKKRD